MATVEAAAEAFVRSLRARGKAANTIRSYAHDLSQFARHVENQHVDKVGHQAISVFLTPGRLSASTARRRHACLSSFFRWLLRHEYVDVNPMERVDPVKAPDRLPRPIAEDKAHAVLATIPAEATRDRALFHLLYETGMRVGEAISLEVSDIDLTPDDELIRVMGKGGRERTVWLGALPRVVRLLRRHLRLSGIESGVVFRGDARFGGGNVPVNYTTVRRAWQKYCEAAGVKATIHQLRHSRASEWIEGGVPLTTVRKALGHRNIQSTMVYVDVSAESVKHDQIAYQRRRRLRGR
jgi:integrase/recombinase XerD